MKTLTNFKNVFEPIIWLLGEWRGKGSGGFPTYDPFEYVNNMHFKIVQKGFDHEPLIHFEEIARVLENGENMFKHWETGYLKPTHDGRIEFYVCHNTGRIEICYGSFEELDTEQKSFTITFESDFIRNDEGTKTALKSRREWVFKDQILWYRLDMSTVDVTEVTKHLEARLKPLK